MVQAEQDRLVENTESLQVAISSEDASVHIMAGVGTINISDATSESTIPKNLP